MTRPALLAAAALALAACDLPPASDEPGVAEARYAEGAFDDPSDELFDADSLPRFDLELDEAAIASLRADPRRDVRATLHYRGATLRDIALRIKGEWTLRTLDGKPSFRLRFDKFVKGQRLLGVSRLVLNNTVQDPSFASERLAYRVFRSAGVAAPRAASSLVYVNGVYYGVYTTVEAPSPEFLGRWFGSAAGNLYEEGGRDLTPGAEAVFELDTNEKLNDRRDLAALIAALGRATPDTFVAELKPHLDLDQFLKFAALEALVGQIDGYASRPERPNNFRIYRDPGTGKFSFLAWGMDRAMRPPETPALVHGWVPPARTYIDLREPHGLLMKRCLAAPECRRRFRTVAGELVEHFASPPLAEEARRLREQLAPAVRADSRKEHDDAYYRYAHETLQSFIAGRAAAARATLP